MPYFGIPIRNGLPIGLGSVAGFGIAPFEPYSLFENGEQGAWYDPSDFSTLFTDSAGTTPVTGVEQFVGLMLDKSKGLVLGGELITPVANQDFSSDTGYWTKAAGVTIGSGICTFSAVANNFGVSVNGVTFAGKYYDITFTISSVTSGSCSLQVNGPQGIARNAPGTYTERLCAGSGSSFAIVARSANTSLTIDSVSVKEVTGNHATQTTSAKRPKLAARYNLLTYSEQFDNGVWTKSNATVTANAVIAPDGTTTADKLVENAANAEHLVFQSITSGSNTISVYAKAAERSWLRMGDSSGAKIWFDLANGTLGSADRPASIQPIGNGWYRCSYVGSNFTNISFLVATGNNVNAYTGDGTSGIYIWGADLRPASQATGLIGPTYQRVVDAATYDAVGFLPYLEFDGLSWSMSTGSIDFSAGDKMTVWAGVRKLSDAAIGAVTELGTSFNGSFSVFAPLPLGPNYGFGTTSSPSVYQTGYAAVAAPSTDVLQGSYNLFEATLANQTKARINAVAKTLTFTGVGTPSGNFMNGALFIGSRAGTSFFLNGWLTSLIVRGAQSTQSQIEATEAWVNGKTGAY